MRPDDFLQLLRRHPFRPLRLYLTDGTTYDIRHPEMALVQRSYVEIQLPASESHLPLADQEVLVMLLHIVRIEFLERPASPAAN
jgi:hypothetical protein